MCAIMMLFVFMLNVSPDIDMDQLSEMLDNTKNSEVQSLLPAFVNLGDIPKPDIYEADKNNHVCLYTEDEFYEAIYDLGYIAELLMDILNCRYSLEYKPFTIDEEDILYDDGYQVVISKETYNARKEDYEYMNILDLLDELDNECEDEGEDQDFYEFR